MTFPWVTAAAIVSLSIWKGAGITDAKPVFVLSLVFGIVRALVDFIKHRKAWAKYVHSYLFEADVNSLVLPIPLFGDI
jgi:hypothetical protein